MMVYARYLEGSIGQIMKKFIAPVSFALILVMAASMVGCGNTGANAVVAKVDGVEIYRWQVDNLYNANLVYYEQQSGLKLDDPKNSERRIAFRKQLLDDLVGDVAVTQKAKESGYDLTEQEKADFENEFKEFMEKNVAHFEDQYPDDPQAHEKALADWQKYMDEQHISEEFLRQDEYNRKVREKFSADLFKDINIPEEQLRAVYDQMVADDKVKYTENPKQYGEDAELPNNYAAYRPAGYVRVKQIMISLPTDVDNEIKELTKKQAEMLLDMQGISEEKGKNDPAIADMDKQVKSIQTQVDELYEKGYSEIKAKADEAYGKATSGSDFDALIKEYGDDKGMTVYPTNEYGYLVGPDSEFVNGFKEAALALENVGDISNVVKSINGYHVVKMIAKVEEGPVPFEDLKDFIVKLQRMSPMDQTLREFTQKTVAEFNQQKKIEVYYSKI